MVNRGSKVIKAYLETSDSMVKEIGKEELQPFIENGVLSLPSTKCVISKKGKMNPFRDHEDTNEQILW
ncbi:pumilio/Puf RNA-binding domain-containing family protein [Dorcoceras hygrometricum]|uniref:Pumilio/Puf RNA-binding domain-containing family protein n=1 Tax=Dorcoceras hygrometricum TaxID=472368 RepID=A0A2Z7CQ18_9LAMI|nr:pumilio/Puf RNA-binding domain-containing family protein [Dorcoceras hygrometricum]